MSSAFQANASDGASDAGTTGLPSTWLAASAEIVAAPSFWLRMCFQLLVAVALYAAFGTVVSRIFPRLVCAVAPSRGSDCADNVVRRRPARADIPFRRAFATPAWAPSELPVCVPATAVHRHTLSHPHIHSHTCR